MRQQSSTRHASARPPSPPPSPPSHRPHRPHACTDPTASHRATTTPPGRTQPAHLQSVYRHLFRRGGALSAKALHAEAGLPRQLADALCATFVPCTSRLAETVESVGGRKLVVELASGLRVETVLIWHEHKTTGGRRCTACVSSQV